MSRDASISKEQTGSFLSVSIFSGLLTGIGLLLAFTMLGLPRIESMVFAALSGFTMGACIYRERVLTHFNNRIREEYRTEVGRLEKRVHYYYEHSLASLAYFDAETLQVEKVSPGFLQMLQIPPEIKVRDKSIVDFLRVSPSRIESIVSKAQSNSKTANFHHLKAEDSHGSQLYIEMSVQYFKEVHMVEATFFVSPAQGREDYEEAHIANRELDRFRRGMYRRETRILELKEEVNEILMSRGREARYRFNHRAEDANFSLKKASGSEDAP